MKKIIFAVVILLTCLLSFPVFSQADKEPTALGLPGDNLDLYAVLALFQKSKTIEEFEKSLNSEKEKINNLDLNNDKKIDFITVVTKKENDSFTFILQDAVSKSETQDIAVILVSKEKDQKYSVQIIGDTELYGKNYIIEPIPPSGTSVTPNPGYTGAKPVAAAPTTVVVESSPVIVYLYSPVYVPYVPPYHYGFYPPYFNPWAPLFFAAYYHNNYYHHAYYHNTVIIHNSNYYSHYSTNYRHSSTTVVHYNQNGNYKGTYQGNNYARPATLPSNAASRPAATTKPATRQANYPSNTSKPATRQTASPANAATRTGRPAGGGRRNR
jgi:hypothetical protein